MIRLLEDMPIFSENQISEYDNLSDKEKDNLIDFYIRNSGNNSLQNIKPTIKYSFDRWGLSPNRNPFLDYWLRIPFTIKSSYKQNFDDLTQFVNTGKVKNLNSDWYLEESLFNRTPEEFEYTVNAFEVVSDKNILKKYFEDTSNIRISDLYTESGKIKPAGNSGTKNNTNTIYGQIEEWDNQSDKANSNSNDEDFSLEDVIKNFRIKEENIESVLENWYNKSNLDRAKIEECINKLNKIFTYSNYKRLTNRELYDIQDKYEFNSLKEVPQRLNRQGQIIFVGLSLYLPGQNSKKDYMIYHNGRWVNYNNFIKSINNKVNWGNLKTRLLYDTYISDATDKNTILKDLTSFLDKFAI